MAKKTKEMGVTIKTLLDDFQYLNQLSAMSFPTKTSYWIRRIKDKAKSELTIYDESRNELVKKFGEEKEDKEGKMNWTVKDENLPTFFEEVGKLQDIEIDLGFNKIKLNDLGDIQIQPNLLMDWLIDAE